MGRYRLILTFRYQLILTFRYRLILTFWYRLILTWFCCFKYFLLSISSKFVDKTYFLECTEKLCVCGGGGSVFMSYGAFDLTFLHLKCNFSLICIYCQYFKFSEVITSNIVLGLCIMISLNREIKIKINPYKPAVFSVSIQQLANLLYDYVLWDSSTF